MALRGDTSVLDHDPPPMSDIFLSYKREDRATARKLANALESEGLTVWWDPKLPAHREGL